MNLLRPLALLSALFLLCGSALAADIQPPRTFKEAKKIAWKLYAGHEKTFYCGCEYKGNRVDLESCGYRPRKNANRASRIEWEHVVPAWVLGHQRQCWQNGGRENCTASDPVFRAMEADMHNLSPAIGEVNGDRSNFRFAVLPSTPAQYGACPTRTDFRQRVTEPRDAVKGQVARIYFYMHDRYGLSMSRQQQQLLMAWDRMYPVSDWERERDRRIARAMGHHNPFVTGERAWSLGHKPHGEGLEAPAGQLAWADGRRAAPASPQEGEGAEVIGNRNSRIYHLPAGCPGYAQVSEKNRVPFTSAAEAEAAGFRKAGNCR